MIECVYAHTGSSSTYPSYINVSCEGDENCQLKVTVRDHARTVETENGSYMDAGYTSETLLSKEHAMDLARSIFKHYQEPLDAYGYPIKKPHEEGIGDTLRARFFPDDHLTGESSRTYEETETVGELKHTRRLVIESIEGDPLNVQVERLATFILQKFDGEPSENEGAIDTAIRLLGDYAALLKAHLDRDASREAESVERIAVGLREGQAEHGTGDTETFAPLPPGDVLDVARPYGGNRPATTSAPLGNGFDPATTSAPLGNGFDVVSPQPTDDELKTKLSHDMAMATGQDPDEDEIPF